MEISLAGRVSEGLFSLQLHTHPRPRHSSPPLTSCPPSLSICVLLGGLPPLPFPSPASCLDECIYIRNADGGFEAIFHLVPDWFLCSACLPALRWPCLGAVCSPSSDGVFLGRL